MRQLETRSNLTNTGSCTHTSQHPTHNMRLAYSAAVPSNGHDLDDRTLAPCVCRRSQLHSVRRKPTLGNATQQVYYDLVLQYGIRLPCIVAGQRRTCLQPARQSQSHTVTHSHTSRTSKVVCHEHVVASTPSWSIACVSDALNICSQCGDTFSNVSHTNVTFVCNVCI